MPSSQHLWQQRTHKKKSMDGWFIFFNFFSFFHCVIEGAGIEETREEERMKQESQREAAKKVLGHHTEATMNAGHILCQLEECNGGVVVAAAKKSIKFQVHIYCSYAL